MRLAIFIVLLGTTLIAGAAAGDSGLLVESYGKLLLVRADGTWRVLSDSTHSAALSPDGQTFAFTTSSQVLSHHVGCGRINETDCKAPRRKSFRTNRLDERRALTSLRRGGWAPFHYSYISGWKHSERPRSVVSRIQRFSRWICRCSCCE